VLGGLLRGWCWGDGALSATIRGFHHDQRTLTLFHYRATAVVASPSDAWRETLAALLETTLYASFLDSVSAEWGSGVIRVQKVWPTRYVFHDRLPVDRAGNVAGDSLPSTMAAVVSRRSDAAGRSNRGRIYMPAIPVTWETDSSLTNTGIATYEAQIATAMAITRVTADATFVPIIFRRNAPAASAVLTSTLVQAELGNMRSRRVGRGE